MPEGDTVATLRSVIEPLLRDRPLVEVWCRWPAQVAGLRDRRLLHATTRGKHLLLHFDDDSVLRVHLGLTGSWRQDPSEAGPAYGADLALALATDHVVLSCLRASEVERLPVRHLAMHPRLTRLGPDLLAEPDFDQILIRARQRDGCLGDLLLDQTVAAGLGNVYRNELCFFGRRHPDTPVAEVDDAALRALYEQGRTWLVANVGRERNTTGRTRPNHWVYERTHQPCLRCGTPIQRLPARGPRGRIGYVCPRCQP